MINPRGLSRRALLQALTVGAGSLAFGASREGMFSTARADAGTPKRLVIFPNANGVPDTVYANPPDRLQGFRDFGQVGTTPTNFTLGSIMKPVDTLGLRDDFVGIEGLEMKRPAGSFDTHWAGITQLLTGITPPDFGHLKSVNASIDQYLGSKLFKSMPWPNLVMGALCDGVSYSHLQDGTMIAAEHDPTRLYSNIFGSLMTGGPDPALVARVKRRQSVLDLVAKDIGAFSKRLPAEDRARAEVQLTAIQEMESRLNNLSVGSACSKPTINGGVDYKSDARLPESMRAFIALTVAAFACDQTRVVLMFDHLSDGTYNKYGNPYPEVNAPGQTQHALSHNSSGDQWNTFRKMKAFNTQLACELAKALKAIPEPSATGQTMLDNTIIYMPTEIGRGHNPAGLQFATLGGKGMGVKTGQYLKLSDDLETPMKNCVANQRMLVSLLNAMGLPDKTFGDEPNLNTGSGPIPGYGTFA